MEKILLPELVDILASKANITKKNAEGFVRSFIETVEEGLLNDSFVKIKDVGTFKLVTVSERESVNVVTGERIQIGSHVKVTFSAEGALRDQVNLPFAHFSNQELDDETTSEELDSIEDIVVETEEERVSPNPEIAETKNPVIQNEKSESESLTDTINTEVTNETSNDRTEEPKFVDTPTESTPEKHQNTEEPVSLNTEHSEENSCTSPVIEKPVSLIIEKVNTPTNWWKVGCIFLVQVLLMMASYYVGYYRILCPCEFDSNDKEIYLDTLTHVSEKPIVQEDTISETKSHKIDSVSKAQPDTITEIIEQLPGGRYEITGTKDVHTLQSGESLRTIALHEYGNAKLAEYIIFYNKIENPDIVPVGKKIKIPNITRKN